MDIVSTVFTMILLGGIEVNTSGINEKIYSVSPITAHNGLGKLGMLWGHFTGDVCG